MMMRNIILSLIYFALAFFFFFHARPLRRSDQAKESASERVSDRCLMPIHQFFSHIMARTS